jgi:hypothetical protein
MLPRSGQHLRDGHPTLDITEFCSHISNKINKCLLDGGSYSVLAFALMNNDNNGWWIVPEHVSREQCIQIVATCLRPLVVNCKEKTVKNIGRIGRILDVLYIHIYIYIYIYMYIVQNEGCRAPCPYQYFFIMMV